MPPHMTASLGESTRVETIVATPVSCVVEAVQKIERQGQTAIVMITTTL